MEEPTKEEIVQGFDKDSEDRKKSIERAGMLTEGDVTLEDLREATKELVGAVDGLNTMIENLIPDLVSIVRVTAEQELKVMVNTSKLESLIYVLGEKDLVKEEEILARFNEKYVPKIKSYFNTEQD